MTSSSAASDLLEQFVSRSHGFQLISEPDFPVGYGFGYAYDEKTNRLYVAGGREVGEVHGKFYEIELLAQADDGPVRFRVVRTWDLPHGRQIEDCVCILYHNKVFIIGGADDELYALKDVYSFDRETGRFQMEASMNEARRYFSAVVSSHRDTILVCGGVDLNSCEEYNDSAKQWTMLPYRLKHPRCRHVSICYKGRIVVAGGGKRLLRDALATTEVIDMDSSNPKWNDGPDFEVQREDAAASIVGDYLVVVGGRKDAFGLLRSIEAIAFSDLFRGTSGQWRLLRGLDMKQVRCLFGMVLVDKYLMAMSGAGGKKTCETLDVSLLLPHVPRALPSEFYKQLLPQDNQEASMDERLQELAMVVGDVYETKLLYTYVKQCIRQGLVEEEKGHAILRNGIEVSSRTCKTEDAIVIYKLILEKAEADGVIRREDFHRFDNRAVLEQVDHTLLAGMRASIEANTQRIEGLERGVESLREQVLNLYGFVQQLQKNIELVNEAVQQVQQNVHHVHQSVEDLKRNITRRRRIEATTSFIASIINAVSIGVGGSLLQGFEKVLTGIVDFGDAGHILQVINSHLEKPETAELREAYASFQVHFEVGVQLASGEAQEVLEDAIAEENAVVALAAIATLAYEEFSEAQEFIEEINDDEDSNNNNIENAAEEEGATPIPESFRDALLSVEDEDKLPLHASVKFADIETLNEMLEEEEDVSAVVNQVDSQGRTALDLAALTGQPEMVQLLTSQGGKYKFKSVARMKRTTRSRSEKHDEYLAYVNSLV